MDRVQGQLVKNCQLLLPTFMASWSIRLLLQAALVRPETVGWSGTVARKSSKYFLKVSTEHPVLLLSSAGSKLNSLHPFTPKELSLALLTAAGAALM